MKTQYLTFFKHYLLLLCFCATSVITQASPSSESRATPPTQVAVAETLWYEQSFQEILNSKIVTATRNDSTVQDAPGVVTVYTEKMIKQMGLRSLKEVLERTTGYYVSRQLSGTTIGSRGYIADTGQFLLLIDGHNMNSIVNQGMGQTFMFPNLDMVKRVEIIRGPGSTLWGSDASLGVINVITKNGGDINGIQTLTSYSENDNSRHINLQAGEEITDDIHYMASFTAAQSDGYDFYGVNGYKYPWHWDQMKDSFQLYSKVQIKNFTIKTQAHDIQISRPDYFQSADESSYNRRTHFYLDLGYQKSLSSTFKLETRFFSDLLKRTAILVSPKLSPKAVTGKEDDSSQENSLGFELLTHWQFHPQHDLLMGYRTVRTDVSPVTDQTSYPIEPTPSSTGSITHWVIPDAIDYNNALFFEDNWQVIPNKLNIILGVRFDNNTLREDSTIVLPRFATNWQASNHWQIKYSYNTGYIRPPVGIGFLEQTPYYTDIFGDNFSIHGAKKSQETASHDLQFNYINNSFRAGLNLYQTDIENAFNALYQGADSAGNPYPRQRLDDMSSWGAFDVEQNAFYINMNDITTQGAELELAYQLSQGFDIYANVSKVFSADVDSLKGTSSGIQYDLNDSSNTYSGFGQNLTTSSGTIAGFPHLQWNIGLNWEIVKNIHSNLHYRGWDEMQMREAIAPEDPNVYVSNETVDLGSEHYVDLNVRFSQLFNSSLDISLFVKNLLNNDDGESTLLLFGHVWREQERNVGASISYKF